MLLQKSYSLYIIMSVIKGEIKMKKFLSLLLTLTIILSAAGMCFAATEDKDEGTDGKVVDIPDKEVPGAPNVDTAVYAEQTTTIEDEDIAAGESKTSTDVVDIGEEEVPKAGSLPDTGGIPAEVFYAAGGLLIVAALILTFARKKATSKN